MGLHLTNNADGSAHAKPIISQLQADFTGTYSSSPPPPSPTAPSLSGATPLTSGKGKTERIRGDELFFSGPLNATVAQNTGNYHVTQKLSKRRTVVVPIRSATYNAGNNSVTIVLAHSRIGKALHLKVSGLFGAGGAPVPTIAMTI
jgi:hypothetical protein